MNIAVLGATGRTGRLLVAELVQRGHSVSALVRNPDRLPEAAGVRVVVGDSRDPAAVAAVLEGADVVVSALGPTAKEATLHHDTAEVLLEAMPAAGVCRFVGISGAGVDVIGDQKSRRDRVISWLVHRLGGAVPADKVAEYRLWAASDRDWTLVRPPRLKEDDPTGKVEHDAHRSARTTMLTRADLATFLADVAENGSYVRQAPLVANAH
jgi:putative NADH-flavin reductase